MKILLTFDYEIFHGKSGLSPKGCLIEPTDRLISLFDNYKISASFFIDVGYVRALVREMKKWPQLVEPYNEITGQIKRLVEHNHSIELHIHPHWEYSKFNGAAWVHDLRRYKLADFSAKDAEEIGYAYHDLLRNLSGKSIQAYRAGGWCIQPFSRIKPVLESRHIFFESSVYKGGFRNNNTHRFDFRRVPEKEVWRFSEDPLTEDEKGSFLEIPIASHKVGPSVYWKLLYNRFTGGSSKAANGTAIPSDRLSILRKLVGWTTDVVSMDSSKSALMVEALKKKMTEKASYFVIIGHPKSMDEQSFSDLEKLISFAHSKKLDFASFEHIKETCIKNNVLYKN